MRRASSQLSLRIVNDQNIAGRIEFVARNISNRAGVRVLIACSLAKIMNPGIDIRKPYTEIGAEDCYSGRTYDEAYITDFINKYDLPCNPTTAFLTPALRNRNMTLTTDVNLVGRPPRLYREMLQLLDDVYQQRVSAEDLLAETLRCLIIFKREREERMRALVESLQASEESVPLAAEAIVKLIQQHLACRGVSRLPVLIVAAAYKAAEPHLGERVLPPHSHLAATSRLARWAIWRSL